MTAVNPRFILLILAALPAALTLYGLSQARATAHVERARSDRCAAAVNALYKASASSKVRVVHSARDTTELIAQLEKARLDAGIATERLTRVAPSPAKQLEGTPFAEVVVQIQLRGVSLAQLFDFYARWRLADVGNSLSSRSVRLSTPREADADQIPELWNAEIEVVLLSAIEPKDKPSQ